jgi:hypothetical protein
MDLVPRPASHWGGIGHFITLNVSRPQAGSRSGVQTEIVSFANSISTFKPAARRARMPMIGSVNTTGRTMVHWDDAGVRVVSV